MKIVFFGTPDYVIPVLEKLHKYHEIVAVVTQSPKPVGRDKVLTYSAVDTGVSFPFIHRLETYCYWGCYFADSVLGNQRVHPNSSGNG